MALPSH